MKRFWIGTAFALIGFIALIGGMESASAISEKGYVEAYSANVVPFLRSGERFVFSTRDGLSLSAVRFVHPHPKATILVLPGRTESWLKYGEVFYDLYREGYSLYAYDHRGQGLSPHLSKVNPEIGHVGDFGDYVRDLEDFVAKALVPAGDAKLYLLAHSMGGAIAIRYLERGRTPFRAAAFTAPMLTINTKPYPAPIARLVAGAATRFGYGERYAPDRGDFDPRAPFEENDVTGSPERFWMTNAVFAANPASVIGGPSNAWVYRSLVATPKIVRGMKSIITPFLMFQAGADRIVKPKGQDRGCASTKACTLIRIPGSQHEVLMEKDAIRDPAMRAIVRFFP